MSTQISKDTEYQFLINDGQEFIDGIIKRKYCINENENNFQDVINRILNNIKDKCNPHYYNLIYNMISNKRFVPAGSILSGLNNSKKCSLSNCYYIPIKDDSIESIFNWCKEAARTFSYRGGCGTDLSVLRPKNSLVNNSACFSTGAVSFLPLLSETTNTIGQKNRRGALIVTLDVRHPDVLDFIWCKSKPEQVFGKDFLTGKVQDVYGANISLKLTDEFIKAVENDNDWTFIFPDYENHKELYDKEWNGVYDDWLKNNYPIKQYHTIKARDLLKQVAESAWISADPGISYWDTVLRNSTTVFDPITKPMGYNPCLPDWSPVLTPNGYRKFADIKNKILLNNNIYECSNLIKTHDESTIYELELESGIKFWSTDNHKISKVNKTNSTIMEMVELNKLKVNDYIRPDYSEIKYDLNNNEYHRGIFSGIMLFRGVISTNEGYNKSVTITLYENITKLEINILKSVSEIFNISNIKFRSGTSYRYLKIQNNEIYDSFIEFFGNSKQKFTLLDKSISFCIGFINAIISINGSVYNNKKERVIKIRHSATNINMLNEIQLVLASLNIYSKLRKATTTFLNIDTPYVLVIPDMISFNKHFPKLLNIKHNGIIANQNKQLDQKVLQNCHNLKWVAQKIKSIKKLNNKFPVYDIQVPGPNLFVSSTITISNCGEQPLGNYNNCLLGALVLFRYVKNPYQSNAEFDMELFLEDVKLGVRFLNLMSDININLHPLEEQRDMDFYGRRIGQEFTGLGDMLAMLNIKYGSSESIEFIDSLLFEKNIVEINESIELAKEIGCCDALRTKESRQKFLKQEYIKNQLGRLIPAKSKVIKDNILKYGLRNISLNTVGPTGTLSIISDNCTSGVEPLFALEYYRKTRLKPDTETRIVHLPLLKYGGKDILNLTKDEIKKKYNYIESHELNYSDRIKIQSIIQKNTDTSVSSTVNLPNDCTIEDIYNIYLEGYYSGLKGITVYREGSKGGVLNTGTDTSKKEVKMKEPDIKKYLDYVKENVLNKTQRAYRYIEYWKGVKVYITVTVDDNGKPFELFAALPYEAGINDKGFYSSELHSERNSYWNSICRLCSLLLRIKTPLEEIIKQLQKSSPTMVDLPAIIQRVIGRFLDSKEELKEEIIEKGDGGELCKECGKNGVIRTGGCAVCILCGNSSCG